MEEHHQELLCVGFSFSYLINRVFFYSGLQLCFGYFFVISYLRFNPFGFPLFRPAYNVIFRGFGNLDMILMMQVA